ncbi:50S ribosomal protein L15 [Parasphingopyxis marina]|uniref:Large ribosomal subunit protein uL15 n=1 Tax=Parasphingopyxis marina TaxID=2761622 RepID=A0A842HVB0_9SPHN|nr:50S ribosomal protein L15 [Parasphingopyxis marina]MBC2776902.1 50S ribosomal protein L15 [Parasphingopyxis marina]
MKLNEIKDNEGARKSRTRVGRGLGSGKGKTGGRGMKGQKSRSGVAIKGFEGGQMPLHMRLPKRGFNNPFGKDYAIVNLGAVQKAVDAKKLDAKKTIDQAALKAANLVRGGKDGVRLLGKGEISAKLNFAVAGASKSALEAVEKAGGKVEIVVRAPKVEKPAKAAKKADAEKAE